MAIAADHIEHEIHIQAPPELVFRFFTNAEMHPRWMGREATLEPKPGGIYRCVVHDTATVIGEYVEVDPPHRLVFTWGFEGDNHIPPGSSTVTITLTPENGGTRLRLIHTGLPHPALAPHDKGWTSHLAQLANTATQS